MSDWQGGGNTPNISQPTDPTVDVNGNAIIQTVDQNGIQTTNNPNTNVPSDQN